MRTSPYRLSTQFACIGFCELRLYGVLRSSHCPAREATQYALVIATIVRRYDHVASKGHRGHPALLHGDVEGCRGTMER